MHDRRSCASALPEDLMSNPLLLQSESPAYATAFEANPSASARAPLVQHPGTAVDASTVPHLLSLHRRLNIPLDATIHCLCRLFGIEIGALAQTALCSRTHLYRCLVGERLPSQRMRQALTQAFGCDPWDQSVPTARRQLTHRLAQRMSALRNHGSPAA